MIARPAVRRLLIVIFVLLIPFAAHSAWDYVELRRLAGRIEAIKQKQEPVSEAGARSPQRGEAQRAGRLFLAAAILGANVDFEYVRAVEPIHEWLSGAVPEPPATAADRLRLAIDDGARALSLVDEAGTLEFRGVPAGTAYSYRVGELMALSRLVGARTMALALAGQGDAAVQSSLSALKLRRVQRELSRPWTIEAGRHETAAILSLASPSTPSLQQLQMALESDESPGESIDRVLSDRARLLELIWRRYYGADPGVPRAYSLPVRSVSETVLRPWISHQTVRFLDAWAELVEAARTPWPGKVDATAAMARRYGAEAPDLRWASAAQVPHPRIAYEAFADAVRPDELVVDRSSRAAVAVERYRRDHQGTLPNALTDLVPQYLASVPQDPCSGGPLLFRNDAASYTIYSVGTDKKDNGGDLNSELLKVIKQGYGRRFVRGADIGVRVLIR